MEFRNGSSYDQWWGSSDATAKESVHDLSLKLDSLADSKIFDISSLVACCSNIATLVIWGADYEQVVDVGVLSQLKRKFCPQVFAMATSADHVFDNRTHGSAIVEA
jgi:hypothetical protein